MDENLIQWSVPIERVDEEERIVEGYAFVNEVVPGEGGMRLKRTAMEAATPDYMRWGAVREMHQPSAAGTALGVEWDEKGARFRAKIVDDDAWKKVTERVYKAFSIGVMPTVVRGKDVEACRWAETSLVDRPKDEGAAIEVFRIEMQDAESGIEEFVRRGEFAEMAQQSEKQSLRSLALSWLQSALMWPRENPTMADVREALDEFAQYWESRGLCDGYNRNDAGDVERGQTSDTVPARENLEGKKKKCRNCGSKDLVDEDDENEPKRSDEAMLTRLESLQSDLDKERSEKEALQVRVAEMENEPRRERPVKFAGVPLERTFGAPREDPVAKLQGEMAEILKRSRTEALSDDERGKLVLRVSAIKNELWRHGVVA